ncbi:hypothetical protein [Microbacterium sp.]|uniref:hypothetical protein n=1 Tax=Microbacterium sp. TaxID=51671 RepID=UPI001AD1220D|nr:hypothetical protein [Microbacterium sp.]MBN9155821.1 hypothetical protein [Microbacterium sp.]
MHLIQLARCQWLVVDTRYRARFLIVEGPLVFHETGDTHVKHRVEWWAPDPQGRQVLTVCDGLLAAETWCLGEIAKADAARAALSDRLDVRRQGPIRDGRA